MPVFHSGQSRLVWHALFESGMRKNEINPEEKKIFIISPWIRDLTSSQSGWSHLSITNAMTDNLANVESMSEVLGGLVKLGYDVTVLTLSTTGKWLQKNRDRFLDDEINMMSKLAKMGVNCRLADNVHMKYIMTPFCVISGSLNLSFNGVHGRNQEATNIFFNPSEDYNLSKTGIENIVSTSYEYNETNPISLSSWSPPVFDWFIDEVENEVSFATESQSNITNFEPVESSPNCLVPNEIKDGTFFRDENLESKYVSSKFIQLVQRIARIVLYNLINTHNEREYNDFELMISPNLENPEISEIIPSLRGLRDAVNGEHYPKQYKNEKNEIIQKLANCARSCLLLESDSQNSLAILKSIEHDIDQLRWEEDEV